MGRDNYKFPPQKAIMQIQIDMKEVTQLMASLRTGGPQVLVRTINNTLKGAKTVITSEIVADVNLTKTFINKQTGKDAEKTFSMWYASTAQVPFYSGKISTKSANVPLIQYSNQRGNKAKYAKKITVMVKRAKGTKQLYHTFRMQMPSGHVGLFEIEQPIRISRTGRPVIKQLYGPRIPDIMSNKETIEDIEKQIRERMDNELNRQLDYMLSIFR